jgi:hypothetical protein
VALAAFLDQAGLAKDHEMNIGSYVSASGFGQACARSMEFRESL